MESPNISPVIEQQKNTVQEDAFEPLYRVLIHNDDITPYDFVISVLLRFFPLSSDEAEQITWTAHSTGVAVVAILSLKEAERRVGQVHFAASLEGFPLMLTIEPE